jgi:hypothetical protein
VKKNNVVVLAMAVSLLLLTSLSANAAPITLENGNSQAVVDPNSSMGMYNWIVDGTDHLYQQWFWYRVGNTAEAPINSLSLTKSTVSDFDGDGKNDVLYLQYTSANNFKIAVKYGLLGGAAGSNASDISEQVTVTNISNKTLDFHFFQYTNYDLNGISADDEAAHLNDNNISQWKTGWDVNNTAVPFTEVVTTTPNHWAIDYSPTVVGMLNDSTPTVLGDGDNGLAKGDMSFAFQWDRTIAKGRSVQFSADRNIALVPEPASLLLLGLGLGGVAFPKRKKKVS